MSRLEKDLFRLSLPLGWTDREEEGRSFLISEDPPGVMCCTAERVDDPSELPNLSRMLAGFLTRTGHPVATDELLRVTRVVGVTGFSWQYAEDERYHRLWILGNRHCWLLLTFSCALSHRDHFFSVLEAIVGSLELAESPTTAH